MQIDYYACRSGMRGWNAEVKVFLAVGTLFLVILLNRLSVSVFVVISMGMLTLFKGRIPWRKYLYFMSVPITFVVLSVLVIAVQFSRQPAGDYFVSLRLFYIYATKDSIRTAMLVFCKAMAGMSALYMMSLSTPVNEIILVLQKLHLPKLFTELMNLIYRYIFILLDAAQQMQTAARARMGCTGFLRSCRSFAGIAGNLFLISLKKANTYYDALVARGYDGRLEFLTEEQPVKLRQLIGATGYFAVLLAIAAAGLE